MPESDDATTTAAAAMITNNNLDYEKNSNTTSTNTNTTTTSNTSSSSTTASTSSSSSSSTADGGGVTSEATEITKTMVSRSNNSNGSANSSSSSSPTSSNAANGNSLTSAATATASYFNRFDNRLAANLAAVITGARFRSSSCSSRSTTTTNNDNATRNRPIYHIGNDSGIGSNHSPATSLGRAPRRPRHLFAQANLNCNDNEKVAQSPSSDEDNSPTELNNCKRLTDKPPLVKRLTMGLLRHNEESRPLVGNMGANQPALEKLKCGSSAIYSNGYINEDSYIDSKFGDSCRQSLTAIPMLDNVNLNDNSEFNLKKRHLRETSSANSSPKIFANRLRMGQTSRYLNPSADGSSDNADDEDDTELKEAGWYQAGISRDIADEVLQNKSPGAFLVRKSSTKPGCYALTLRVPSPPGPKIANYIILRTARGYKIKGFRKEFSSLRALITHHSVMPELLPVPLAMPRPTNMSSSRRNLDDFDTYDSLQILLKYLRAKNIEAD